MFDPCIPSVPLWNVPHASITHRLIHFARHAAGRLLPHVGPAARVAGPIADHICQFAFKGAAIGILALAPPVMEPTAQPPAPHGTGQTAAPASLGSLGALAAGLSDAESRIVYGQLGPIPVQYGYDIWGPYVVTPGGGGNPPSVPTNPSTPISPPRQSVPEPTTLGILAAPLAALFALAALRAGRRPLPVRLSPRLNGAGT
jgi:hypothetical protein